MLAELLQQNVPRYTSYPTAPHFSPDVMAVDYAAWLGQIDPDAAVSLYVHVPFCDELCLYCGCNTTVARREAPRAQYTQLLEIEVAMVAAQIGRRQKVSHIHWGGGTPTALPAACLRRVNAAIRAHFEVLSDAEIAVEIDPRHLAEDRLSALAEIGLTRASLGVQDFDPRVQAAIGRWQSFEQTQSCAQRLRDAGARSINLDLIYGLPYQTESGATDTARLALELRADRMAVFGYAHVPWMKPHQRLLPTEALPGVAARLAQRGAIDRVFVDGGFSRVGLDHYALPEDTLAKAAAAGSLRRNFQGYTIDIATTLIGIGASSIGSMPQGYVQNAPRVPEYATALRAGVLPCVRGVRLTPDDRLRREVIERLMCHLSVNLTAVARRYEADAMPLIAAVFRLQALVEAGLLRWDGQSLEVTEDGRPFVRTVAAAFDAYWTPATTRHASAA